MMQAVILAAGMGKRLKELTNSNTKCMVEVNGITLIERMLIQLDELCLSSIIIVIGYKGDVLKNYIKSLDISTPIIYVNNEIYNKTNNIYSLYLARNYLMKEDTILLESDLIFEKSILTKLMENPYPSLALVAKYESWMDGTVVTLDENNEITSFLNKRQFDFNNTSDYFKTVNIYKFSKCFSNTHYIPFLEAYSKALGDNEYYEQVLKVITLLEKPEIKAIKLENECWYEIDDIQDLDIAESIFTSKPIDKLIRIQNRYGGYWRYPNLIDFCYLVNPYYPSKKLKEEIKANCEQLICEYPSGMTVNTLLAAKYFGISQDNIIIGNGAAELIKLLIERINGNIGIVLPTFEEYPNRCGENKIIPFKPNNKNLEYGVNELIDYYNNKDIKSLLLINPDNPSGNYISKVELLNLCAWANKRNISLVIDESFVDFVDVKNETTLIKTDIIEKYANIIVVKSISKSYGVPGLRLGVLISSDKELIKDMKEDISIWNINSFGEFFMQIIEKYRNDYNLALHKFKDTRLKFLGSLESINGLRVLPTQANYVMCEIINGRKAIDVVSELLAVNNIFIKDLSSKKGINGEYIRIAVKRPEENDLLIKSLDKIINERL